MENIKIRELAIYHPEKQVDNSYYLDFFRSQNKEIAGLLRSLGRQNRYIIDNEFENTITMGIEAAFNVLTKANLKGSDMDMIIFSSQFPEYTIPSQSLILHSAIDGKEDAICFDTNANCVGMLITVSNTIHSMLGNPHVKRALIVGADFASVHCKKDDEMTYPNFGDAAAAIILEKTSDSEIGFIDSMCKVNGSSWRSVKYPSCGSSKLYDDALTIADKNMDWKPFNGKETIQYAIESINTLLKRNNLVIDNIDHFCFSQYAKFFSTLTAEKLNQDVSKFIYVGDKYGYTGTSSPFMAMHEGIKDGRIKRGDLVCLWSLGHFWNICTIFIRY
jgi:3-oxoacyl-[acyl-carrier-protein] synthase-3